MIPVASGDPHGGHGGLVTIFLTVHHLLRCTGLSLYLRGGLGLAWGDTPSQASPKVGKEFQTCPMVGKFVSQCGTWGENSIFTPSVDSRVGEMQDRGVIYFA